MSAIKDLVDLVDTLNKSKADREIMPLIIEINKITEQVKVENTQLMTENTTLKSENSKLKEQLSKLNTEPTKTVINSKPRVFTDESMRNF